MPTKKRARTTGWRKSKPESIDAYLEALSADQRAALAQLRKAIRAIVPRAEECISYQLPAFRLDGRMLIWFGAAKHHCSLFPGTALEPFKVELQGFDTGKGTVRFQPDHPLPVTLVRRLLRARIAMNTARERKVAARRERR